MAAAIAWLGSLPPDVEVDVTVRPPLEEMFRPMTAAERAREYRRRKRDGVTDRHETNVTIVTEGVGGGLSNGSEKEAEKQERETQIGFNLTGSTGVERHAPSRDSVTVFEFWREDTSHSGSKLDRKRQRRIEARLREGFSVERLCTAIANRRNDPFLMGENDTGRVYDGIETLLRDAAQVERLEALTTPVARPSSTRVTAQTPASMLAERARRMAAGEPQ